MISSLVAFLAQPISTSLDVVQGMAARALGPDVQLREVGVDLRDASAHRFGFHLGEESFVVVLGASRYALEEELQSRIESPEIRGLFGRHVAWFAVEWDESPNPVEYLDVYGPIAKLVAEVCEDNALALFSPQYDRFAEVDRNTADRLRSDQPLSGFGVMHTALGCLVKDGDEWHSAFPTDWGWVETVIHGRVDAPDSDGVEQVRDVLLNDKIRAYRSALSFSLLFRPFRVAFGADRSVGVHFRNAVTGSKSRVVYESEVELGS